MKNKSTYAPQFELPGVETAFNLAGETIAAPEPKREKRQDDTREMFAPKITRRSHLARCKFCGANVDLDDEGVTYRDGASAHDDCHDANEFERENSADLRD